MRGSRIRSSPSIATTDEREQYQKHSGALAVRRGLGSRENGSGENGRWRRRRRFGAPASSFAPQGRPTSSCEWRDRQAGKRAPINTGTDNTASAVFPSPPSPPASVDVVARSPFQRPAAKGNALALHAYFRLLPQKERPRTRKPKVPPKKNRKKKREMRTNGDEQQTKRDKKMTLPEVVCVA